jgi:hypothetical protein
LTSSESEVNADGSRTPKTDADKAVAYDYLREAQQLQALKWPAGAKPASTALIQILQKLSYDSNQLSVPSDAATAQTDVRNDVATETTASETLRHELGLPQSIP